LGAQDTLEFINGAKWIGLVKEFDKETILLKSEHSSKDLPFKVNSLKTINFKKNNIPFKNKNIVQLTNGDSLVGDLLTMSEKQLTIDTTFAGVLILPRKSIKKIQYNTSLLYLQTAETLWPKQYSSNKSPLDLKGKYDFKHPTLIEANLSGNNPSLSLSLSGSSQDRDKYFQLQFYLRKYNSATSQAGVYFHGNGQSRRSSINLPKVSNNIKIQAYINPKKGLFIFYVNGQLISTIDLGTEVAWENRMININLKDNLRGINGASLDHFTVEKWSGKKPVAKQDQFSEKDMASIKLLNGDTAWGKIININKEKLRFKSVLGDLSIPMNRIAAVLLTNPAIAPTKNTSTLNKGPLQISGDVSLKGDILQVSNSYLFKQKLKKEHFNSLNRPSKTQMHKEQLSLLVGESVIKGKLLKLKNEVFEVESDNLLGKHELSSQKLKSINFTRLHIRSDRTRFTQQIRRRSPKGAPKNWTIELSNGDSFQTTQYFLSKSTLTFNLGELPLVIDRSQVNKISLNKKQLSDKELLHSLPDRYSIDFNISLEDKTLEEIKKNGMRNYLFYLNSRSKTTTIYTNFTNVLKYASLSQTIAGTRKNVPMDIKSHNKIILKNHNHFKIKFDHKKGLIEIWGNGQLLDSTGNGKPMEKFTYINSNSSSRGIVKISQPTFRPWETINSKSFVLDKNMKVYEGAITSIDQKEIKVGDKKVKLENISEVILNNESTKSNVNITVSSKHGVFHVKNLEIEDSKVIFKYGSNPKLTLPFDQLLNIKFIDKP
jgi:sRNA-binding regulator protein Hfq